MKWIHLVIFMAVWIQVPVITVRMQLLIMEVVHKKIVQVSVVVVLLLMNVVSAVVRMLLWIVKVCVMEVRLWISVVYAMVMEQNVMELEYYFQNMQKAVVIINI